MHTMLAKNNLARWLWSARSSIILFATVFAFHLVIALAVGALGWDDGYITLSFSSTFAETGHIGLTPYSETVEGATSPVWFLLMAGAYKLGITSFYGLHLASQLLAALCAATTAVLFYRLVRSSTPPRMAWGISLIILLLGPFRAETGNGMEMTLLCVVMLGIMNSIRDSRSVQPLAGIIIFSALVPWVRLEASGYIIMGALAVAVFSRHYRAAMAIVASCLTSIFLLSMVRHLVFHAVILPNTIKAKMLSPFSPPVGTLAWMYQLLQDVILEPLVTFVPSLVIGLFLLRVSGARAKAVLGRQLRLAKARELSPRIAFGTAYCASFVAFIFVFGANWFNVPGRMGMSAMLALIAATVLAIPVIGPIRQLNLRMKALIAAVALLPYLGIPAEDVSRIYVAHTGSGGLVAKTSIKNHLRNAEAINHVRELLGRPTISALFIEIGAAGLCCKRIDIMDLGLLANSELANGGWGSFSSYLENKRPEVIQPHGMFSQESGIYENHYFRHNYTPVVVYDSLFYLRNDDYDKLRNKCVPASVSVDYFYSGWNGLSSKKNVRPAGVIDRDYINSLNLDSFCRLP
jgi:hypothetical protein